MKLNYKKLGQYIRQVDVRNTEGKEENLLGVSVQKQFIPSIANTVGTDFTKYKVVRKGQFTYIPDTSRRGDKIGIALLENYDEGLVSNVYTVFEVIDENQLMPEYLMLWFSRPEFDRYARYKSHGSVREIFDWDELCMVELPVPDIAEQRKIVKAYQAITDRIELKKRINDNLEATIQVIFKSMFIDYEGADYSDYIDFEFGKYPANWNLVDLDSIIDVRDGTHDSPSPTESGKYLITSRHLLPYAVDRSGAYFINETDYNKANERSKVEYGDILFSMIGTIGIISFITDREIDFAIKNVGLFRTSQNPTMRYFILSYLKSKIVENHISSYMAGSTQSYVSLNVLRKIPLILPPDEVIHRFEKQVTPLYAKMIENTHETIKLNDLKDVITTSMSSR
jgi:restriction endonuclease, S subunit